MEKTMTREEKINYLLSAEKYDFEDLVLVVEVLRGEGGCPWDREQTHKSIRKDFIEETYEVIEAIDTDDRELLREELGDVMLQVVFHARMEEEDGGFNIDDVCSDICKKLIHRHPHVFGDVEVGTSKEVLDVWNAIKNDEKQRVTVTDKLNRHFLVIHFILLLRGKYPPFYLFQFFINPVFFAKPTALSPAGSRSRSSSVIAPKRKAKAK